MNVLEDLTLKFTSGNDNPVTKATITIEEWNAIIDLKEEKDLWKKEWEDISDIAKGLQNRIKELKKEKDLSSRALSEYIQSDIDLRCKNIDLEKGNELLLKSIEETAFALVQEEIKVTEANEALQVLREDYNAVIIENKRLCKQS